MLYTYAFAIGLIKNLAFPYFNVWYILFFVFPVLYLLGVVYSKSFKQRFLLGFCFGFSFVLGGFYWLYNAVYISTASPLLASLAVVGKSIIIGFFYSFLFVFKDIFKNKNHIVYVFLMALSYTIITFVKTNIVPWYDLPIAFSNNLTFIQFLRFTNINIANFIFTCVFLIPLVFFVSNKIKHFVFAVVAMVSIFSLLYIDGYKYINSTQDAKENKEEIFVKLIQPNVDQIEKVRGINTLERHKSTMDIAFSNLPETESTTLIVLPESAFDGYIKDNDNFVVQDIAKRLKDNQYVITGALRQDDKGNTYNSLFTISNKGIVNYYDKYHLVPVGEYLPFTSKSVVGNYGFAKGDGYKVLSVENVKFLPLICYEVGFLGKKEKYENINFIINITNDAWYGKTTQPYHHLALSAIHAISSKHNVFRVSNNGITALFNKHGVALVKTRLYTKNSVLIKLSI